MERFIGVKLIMAKPMTRGEYNKYRGWKIPPEENPEDHGYLVEYPPDPSSAPNHENHEGYISWSPAEVFLKAYRLYAGLSFGMALEAIKKGLKVAREGWNGKDMFIYIQEGSLINQDQARNPILKEIAGKSKPLMLEILPHIDMKAADGKIVIGWLASQTDMLSEDWFIVK